jgi:hypothetical protein
MTGDDLLETMKQTDPDSVWLFNHPSYPPNPPTRTFTDERAFVKLASRKTPSGKPMCRSRRRHR